jgi:hypothetical protein
LTYDPEVPLIETVSVVRVFETFGGLT